MLRKFASLLTYTSNYFVDWSRVGELVREGTHRYTKDQLVDRAIIIGTTAISGFLGAHLNDSEKTNCSTTTVALASAAFGFVVSHLYIISPLIYKRYMISQACKQLSDDVRTLTLNNENISPDFVNVVIDNILKLSMANEKRDNASLTWGNRKSMLTNLYNKLVSEDNELTEAMINKNIDDVMALIKNDNTRKSTLKA